MRCAKCNRKTGECVCPKIPVNGKWPKGTWFQKRLKLISIAKFNGKEQHGGAEVQIIAGLFLGALIAWAIVTHLNLIDQTLQQWRNIERCVSQLYSCSNS